MRDLIRQTVFALNSFILLLLIIGLLLVGSPRVFADTGVNDAAIDLTGNNDCNEGVMLNHAFSSGAQWIVCAVLNPLHGLELRQIHFRAPGNFERSVLQSLHLGQLLLHPHDSVTAVAQFGTDIRGHSGLGGSALLPASVVACDGEIISVAEHDAVLCSRVQSTGLLAKYGQRRGLHSSQWHLSVSAQRDAAIWTMAIALAEDGSIHPSVSLSGQIWPAELTNQFDTAMAAPATTVLSTWRIAFDLDSEADDRVEEFSFPLNRELGNRRPMQVTALQTETFRKVDREQFRGWRVLDGSGAGYYLDPGKQRLCLYQSQPELGAI